ncbi:MAG: HAD family hydrolase [Chloroflexi bacterium]|nr:HAD family hydrolase [Chloroflexota bacterium]
MRASVLLFDFHDTVVHLPRSVSDDELHLHGARQVEPFLRAWGATVDGHEFCRQLLARARQASNAAATCHVSPDFAAIIQQVARDAGLRISADQVEMLWQAWYVSGPLVGEELYPDALATLTWAKRAGYRLGLVTNRWFGRTLLERDLRAHGVDGLFDTIVVSCDVGYEKPHREIFRLALAALGLPAEQAVMVGDSLRADVAGAKHSGLRAVWKRNRRPQPPVVAGAGPDAVIDDLGELSKLPLLTVEALPGDVPYQPSPNWPPPDVAIPR